eukprot:CAMPEP_0115123614 /NCGR_PEP_ID=MMETSP0227-20121206/47663_1 /TAXON_ID=89957 /ORGANISM="Polarella glacialis, Strain CCMP 1383" /LENGTH=328 /DNA_ID=CAMNT_0002526051 /DNA_START=24 /DNA_END=1013 /DNA_ORIENTATION=-
MTAMVAEPKEATAPKRAGGGIDYSKFDNIEDSDDEKPQTTTSTKKVAEVERPHCHNCHKDIQKPLRCGVCKKVSYCCAQCQKDDWPYHKRACKKPEEPKADDKGPGKKALPGASKEDNVVDNDNEKFTWYRHREWKPTEEPKKEFKPVQIDASEAEAATPAKPPAGSVWNTAGTWEEKDVTALAQKTLRESMEGLTEMDAAGGVLSATSVDSVEGDASKPVIRGTMRHMFDLSFKVKFVFKWMDSDGQRRAEGTVAISDFTHDTFAEGVLAAPVVELIFKEAKQLEVSRRHAVEAAVGRTWPPTPAGSLLDQVSSRMKAWVTEYEQSR